MENLSNFDGGFSNISKKFSKSDCEWLTDNEFLNDLEFHDHLKEKDDLLREQSCLKGKYE